MVQVVFQTRGNVSNIIDQFRNPFNGGSHKEWGGFVVKVTLLIRIMIMSRDIFGFAVNCSEIRET